MFCGEVVSEKLYTKKPLSAIKITTAITNEKY